MARLPQGVRKRNDGILEKRITIDKKRYSIYGINTKELTEKENELRENIKNNTYIDNKNITLDKYFQEWIKRKENHNKSNTIYTYKTIYNTHIKDAFKNMKISKIEKRNVLAFQEKLTQEKNPATVNYIINLLRMILAGAVADEIISKNPTNYIKPIKYDKKTNKTKHRALTEEEQKHFMHKLKSINSYYYNIIAFMLLTGARFGEVTALTWNDIDYKNNVIHINKTITKDKNGVKIIGDSAKSKAGERDIPITNDIRKVLKNTRGVCNILPYPTNLLYPGINGGYMNNCVINNEIKRIIKMLHNDNIIIESFTVHALRDTFATRFIEQGGNPQTLKNILGHSSLSMTMDIYAQVLPNTKQKEMDNLKIIV